LLQPCLALFVGNPGFAGGGTRLICFN